MEKNKKHILSETRSRLLSIYNSLRLDSTAEDKEVTLLKLKELMLILDELTNDNTNTLPDIFRIVADENLEINDWSTLEVKTNVTGLNTDDELEILLDESLQNKGNLELSSHLTSEGIKFYLGRKISSPASYKIKEGDLIGIGIKSQAKKYSLFQVAELSKVNYEEAVKEVCNCDLLYGFICEFHQNPDMRCSLSKWKEMSTQGDQYGISKESRLFPKSDSIKVLRK